MPLFRRALLALALASAALLAAGCSAPSEGSDPSAAPAETIEGGTLVYATGYGEPSCLDPHVGGYWSQALLATQVLEPLFGRSADGEIVPWLAESGTPSEDGLSWDIVLKDGIAFTDGTPFDAEAVKANIEHMQDPETGSSTGRIAVKEIESVDIVDDTHLTLNLSRPKSALLEVLSQHWAAMESPAGIERGKDANCQAPIGTGPFVYGEWTPQESILLTRNDDYVTTAPEADHDGPAHLEAIEWRFIPDAATRQAALVSDEVQMVDSPLPTDIMAAEGQGITHINAPRAAASNRVELNMAQAPFDDIRVREAFIRSADPTPGIETLFAGTAERSYSVMSSMEPFAYSDESLFSTDTERAAELLDEAGWVMGDDGIREKDGKKLTVRFPVASNQSTQAEQSLFEQIQANTAKVGFDVQLNVTDLWGWYENLFAYEYEAVSAPYTTVGPDVLRITYHSDSRTPEPSGYFANVSGMNDPEVDALLDEALATTDEAGRKELYTEAQKRILESYAAMPIYDEQNHYLTKGVEGVVPIATINTPTLINAALTK
ncbi:peptide ABC transporter [Microbacterium nanhaiense]|uniref:Peptide ABC transporter n=1 Tax=Microbacterium nanhaiense TaxID=1301026 RepID=A0ABQ2MVV5_9MICO|nr:ABC transporter substrate-binding protein [Microbacterium nanhaiense]GGO59655.1 peptide ABC transporter [Microbacterium nanhaiense]